MTALNTFVVRPFGKKPAKDGGEVDFERVHTDLLQPALDALGLSGGTTGEILRAGNIRRDMFQRLLTADLVIADLSIHNANVFYELGIRHALRDRRTFLIRSKSDEVPFDLKTDRYLEYDRNNPGASKDDLIFGLKATIDSESSDSPIFEHLPMLTPADPRRFVVVPRGFREDLARAAGEGRRADIALLATEIGGQDWATEALRGVGRALLALNALRPAAAVWESVAAGNDRDREANLALGEAYQRLRDFARSDQALARLLEQRDLPEEEQAGTLSLTARNSVHHWIKDWEGAGADRTVRALRSPHLREAFDRFLTAFRLDLQSFRWGCDALWTGTLIAELADKHPDVWEESFNSGSIAQLELANLKQSLGKVSGAVELALDLAQSRTSKLARSDPAVLRCRAEIACATTDRPKRVGAEYRKAAAGVDSIEIAEMRRRLEMFTGVDVRKENAEAALAVLNEAQPQAQIAAAPATIVVFCGDRVDTNATGEPVLAGRLRALLVALKESDPRVTVWFAGDPAGLVLHGICEELGVSAALWLSCPRTEYLAGVSARYGGDWNGRLDEAADRLPVKVLQASAAMPSWTADAQGYTLARRTLVWMLHNALDSADRVVLVLPRLADPEAGQRDLRAILGRVLGGDVRVQYVDCEVTA